MEAPLSVDALGVADYLHLVDYGASLDEEANTDIGPAAILLRSLEDERAFGGSHPHQEVGTSARVPSANYGEGMVIGVTPGVLGSGSHRVSVDAVVPEGDSLSVYVTVHEACVTTNDLVLPYVFVFVPRDPRPVRLMPVRYTGPHLYGPGTLEESVDDPRCVAPPEPRR